MASSSLVLWLLAMVVSLSLPAPSAQELVPEQPLVLEYHGGEVLGAGGAAINVYVLFYGSFTPRQQAIVAGFFRSVGQSGAKSPSVKSWWNVAARYKDGRGKAVPAAVKLAGQAWDSAYSLGKSLKEADLETLVQGALEGKKLPRDASGLYFLLTAADVQVETFCRDSCGKHRVLQQQGGKVAYAWVGNSASQCPGMCAWPFAPLPFPGAPATAPAKSPNGDVGVDGMVINIASMLAGAATNPFGNAFYQGDALAPLEAATACSGNYGPHSYPGYPGDLLTDARTGGSFNVYGYKKWRFVLPALVDPVTAACTVSA